MQARQGAGLSAVQRPAQTAQAAQPMPQSNQAIAMQMQQPSFNQPKPEEQNQIKEHKLAPVNPNSILLNKFHSIAAYLQGLHTEFEQARQQKETEWLEDLRAWHGEYDPSTKAKLANNPNRSSVFFGLTKTKVITAYSRIIDIYFSNPLSDFWSITPTAVPDLPETVKQRYVIASIQQVAQAAGVDPSDPRLSPIIKMRYEELMDSHSSEWREEADKSAKAMTREIRDILDEADAEDELKAAIMESCIIGTGCISGVNVKVEENKSWEKSQDNVWSIETKQKISGGIEAVSCFDLYPDPHCKDPKKLERLFHRKIVTRTALDQWKTQPNFFPDQIDNLLSVSPTGNHVYKPYEQELNRLSGINSYANSNKYEVLLYWGVVPGYVMQGAGFQVKPNSNENVLIYMCAGYILGVRRMPTARGDIPYKFFPYEKSLHSFYGTGVPRNLRDSQETLNSAIRLFIDNNALASGPIVEVNIDMLAPEEVATADNIFPWRVFKRTSAGGEDSSPAIRFYQPRSVAPHVLKLIDMMRRFADEESNLPSYTSGMNGTGLNQTASGMSMLMGAANVAQKAVLKNLDSYCIKPLIRSGYDHVMRYSENVEAKSGDIKVKVHGSSSLVAKELTAQRNMQFLSMTANPLDAPQVKRHELLKNTATALDIDPEKALMTEDELDHAQRQQQQPAPQDAHQPQQPEG